MSKRSIPLIYQYINNRDKDSYQFDSLWSDSLQEAENWKRQELNCLFPSRKNIHYFLCFEEIPSHLLNLCTAGFDYMNKTCKYKTTKTLQEETYI